MYVTVRSVSKAFGDVVVLDDFSCTIQPGIVTALVGPSGSGKSTLLAAMAGFQNVDSGEILYLDDDGATQRPDPQSVAWVPQGANSLGARTALDNVRISALAAGRTLSEATEMALTELTKVGLGHRLDTSVKFLSGGELQRVAFARALTARKPLIFADEPTSSLDTANTAQITQLLLDLRSSATIIVATHDPRLVDAAQDVIEIRRRPVNAD